MTLFLIDWPSGTLGSALKIGVTILVIYLAVIWVALAFWTYRDIRQRTRDPLVQTVAVLLVLLFFLPGYWVYRIVRPAYTLADLYERSLAEEALLQELEDQKSCPTCKVRVRDDYLVCPACRQQLKEPCRNCTKPLSYAWISCPYCGAEKPLRERPVPRQVPPQRQPVSPPAAVRAQPPPPQRPSAPPQRPPQQAPTYRTAPAAQPQTAPPMRRDPATGAWEIQPAAPQPRPTAPAAAATQFQPRPPSPAPASPAVDDDGPVIGR